MKKCARFVVLAVSLFGALSATAGAVTWKNSGDTAFTATGGAVTLTSTGANVSCSSGTITGTVASGPFVGATWSVATGTGHSTSCSLAGVATTVHCSATLTATSWAAGTPAVTTGTSDVTCDVRQFGAKICHIGGTGGGTYTNPVLPSTFGKLATGTGTGNLKVSNGTSGTCPLGNGDRAFVSPGGSAVNGATGGPTPHLGPIITRTP
ncbi:MAG: hypothetical protein JWQ18_37 [Conexibacter sp.]|nr:hypothetical protein [Conexibacter sp.]